MIQMIQVGMSGVLDTEIINNEDACFFSCFVLQKSMSMLDLCVAKFREGFSELLVHHNTCLSQSVHPSLDLDHHMPVFRESSQAIVLDHCKWDIT